MQNPFSFIINAFKPQSEIKQLHKEVNELEAAKQKLKLRTKRFYRDADKQMMEVTRLLLSFSAIDYHKN